MSISWLGPNGGKVIGTSDQVEVEYTIERLTAETQTRNSGGRVRDCDDSTTRYHCWVIEARSAILEIRLLVVDVRKRV